MKISEMSTGKASDILLIISPEIEKIVEDLELIKMIQKRKLSKDKIEAISFGIGFTMKLSTYLLKNHKQSIFNILGALNDKKSEEILKQLLPITLAQLTEMLNDKDLMVFFP